MKLKIRIINFFKMESNKEENSCRHRNRKCKKRRLVVRTGASVAKRVKVGEKVKYIAIKRKEDIVVKPITISPVFPSKESESRVVNRLRKENIKNKSLRSQ